MDGHIRDIVETDRQAELVSWLALAHDRCNR